MNENYVKALDELFDNLPQSKYFVVGSVALLSYTKSNNYDRQIHDIDIILDSSQADIIIKVSTFCFGNSENAQKRTSSWAEAGWEVDTDSKS